jgi:hypothetical protein
MYLMRAFMMLHPSAGGFNEDFPARDQSRTFVRRTFVRMSR